MKISKTEHDDFQLPGARVGIVAARFNGAVVDGLLQGALDMLQRHGVNKEDVDVVYVPGAFELPLAAQRMAAAARYDALVALGAVIRGDTAHFEYVAGPCANGLAEVALRYDLPVGFGVLTVNTELQAIERAAQNSNNKGAEAALAALEMVRLLRQFERPA